MSDKSGSSAARGALMAGGISLFAVGVVFTLTMPDNIALGLTFMALGVIFFSLSAGKRPPGKGPEPEAPAEPGSGDSPGGDGPGSRDS